MVEISDEELTLLLKKLIEDNKELKREIEDLKKEKITDREIIKNRLKKPITFSRTRRSAKDGPGDEQEETELSKELDQILEHATSYIIADGRRIMKL